MGVNSRFFYWVGYLLQLVLKRPHTADSGFTAGSRRLPALCQCRRVTQGTQNFGGGFLRHFAALASLFLVAKLQRMQFPSGK